MKSPRAAWLLGCAAFITGASVAARGQERIVVPRVADGPSSYTLQIVDLAERKDLQVVVDREKGQYLGHPTTALLPDGRTILAVYPKGHGAGPIVLKRSTDGGLSWSERLPTPESWKTSKETPTLYTVSDSAGKRRLILFSGLFPIRMALSADDGATWSDLSPIGRYGGIVAMSSLLPLRPERGHHLALFHDDGRFFTGEKENSPKGFRVYQTLSADGGLTWSEPRCIASHPLAHLCEPGLVRSPDGNQLAALLRENSRRFNSFAIFSSDEGSTWSEPRELPGALTGDRHTCRYAPDGRLVVTFRDFNPSSPTHGDWVVWVGRYEDILRGTEGSYRIRLMKNHHREDCGYPGLELLPDGTFVATTYGHWVEGEPPFVVSVRFTLALTDSLLRTPKNTE